MFAVDFGADKAFAIHGPDGPVDKKSLRVPRVPGKKTPAQEFTMPLEKLLQQDDVVVESTTIGSSGCEVTDVERIVAEAPHRLYTISARAVKNYRLDHKLPRMKGARYGSGNLSLKKQSKVHAEDAKIIYRIAIEQPYRLHHWTGPRERIERIHRSVRPLDKRGYRDDRSNELMNLLPPYEDLPKELQEILGKDKNYHRSMVIPFALASTEPHIDEGPRKKRRSRYGKVIGLYDQRYPSFYSRAVITWMQSVAKKQTGLSRIKEVSREERKQAWKDTQRQIRQFFHLTMAHQGR